MNDSPQSVDQLEDLLSQPSPQAVEALGALRGDLMLLGVGGKMGPTLARMAMRGLQQAGADHRVIGVSRFSNPEHRQRLESWGVETIAGDLLDEQFVESLPSVQHVIHMTGYKFGTSEDPTVTWATNCYLPSLVCRKFSSSRLVTFSTGNVYALTPAEGNGSVESDTLRPVGEYGMAALGRERLFAYFARWRELPTAILRLNYATEMRYGVLVDIAQQVSAEQPVDVSMGFVNAIWQADASAMTLAALSHTSTPATVINIAGEKLSVRHVARQLGQLLEKPVSFTGSEGADALLSDGRAGYERLGRPRIDAATLIRWTADWIARGGQSLGKPTKFQNRQGAF